MDSDLGLTTLTRKKLIREEKDKILHRQNQEEHEYLDGQEEDGEKKTIIFRENMIQEKHALEKRQLEEVSFKFYNIQWNLLITVTQGTGQKVGKYK